MSATFFSVSLKQHTPIIHFQHYLNGATLRASELKPKLDKFLINKLRLTETKRIGEINKTVPKEIYKTWFNNKEKLSLNYKINIRGHTESWKDYIEQPKKENGKFKQKVNDKGMESTETHPYPFFFGNVGKNYYDDRSVKKFVFDLTEIQLNIQSFSTDLIKAIINNLNEFFVSENFGSRQDKGFGSFYIDSNDEYYQSINETLFDYKFEIVCSNNENHTIRFKSLFNQIDLFYRALRSGINLKNNNGGDKFYCKSILFIYFKNKRVQWEKKTIKEEFFLSDVQKNGRIFYEGLTTQQINRPSSDALLYSNKDKKLIKDLLGLSTEESWQYYKNSITKTEAKDDHGIKVKKDKNEEKIERFKSPIFFKIVESKIKGKYTVYVKLSEDIPIKGKWFIIENKFGKNFPLQIPSEFSLHNFFEFITDKSKFDIENHVEACFRTEEQYQILENIFNNLQPTQKAKLVNNIEHHEL